MNQKHGTEPEEDPNEPFEDEDEMFSRDERFQDDAPEPERRHSWSAGARGGVSDFVRRAIENTMGSVQSKGSAGREALQFLLQQGDRGRKELLRIVANEVGDFLRGVDVSGEVVKVLTGLQIDFNANIKFKRSEEDGKLTATPDLNVDVRRPREPEASVRSEEDPDKPAGG